MKELISIISELHAPKNKTNTFGKFNYRDAAGILEAVKPLLVKYECLLNCDAEVVTVGDRFYVVATATITNAEGKSVSAEAPAREQDSKSGMDAAQLTGACISYAKKYALCNLFCIDDSTDDPDTDNATSKLKTPSVPQQAPKAPSAPSAPQPAPAAPKPQNAAPKAKKKASAGNDAVEEISTAGAPLLDEYERTVYIFILRQPTLAGVRDAIAKNNVNLMDAKWGDLRDRLNIKFSSK